jgi:4-amino-4-deoxy-L-arabinose transferase-like glycosyltransferase
MTSDFATSWGRPEERLVTLAALLIVLVGGLLRFWALGHGIPYAVGVDEPEIMERVVRMMKTGDLHPRFFDYPGLYLYLQLVVACARFLHGAVGGEWASLEQATTADFYLWARALTASVGTATIWIVYRAARRWGPGHGLAAAALMAVIPGHVRESHYVLTDVPMTFFTALTLLLALRAHERGTLAAFAWAGIAAGLATATKYTAGLALLMPLAAALATSATVSRLACALASGGAFVLAFLLAAPYTLLDLPGFLNAFAYLASHYRPRPMEAEPGWSLYLKHLRRGMLQGPGFLLLLAGLVLSARGLLTGPRRAYWLLLLVYPLTYFYFISTKTLIYGRYLLPILPFAGILVAVAVVWAAAWLRRPGMPRGAWTAGVAALLAFAIVPPSLVAIDFNRTIARQSTQAIAYDWIVRHLPERSRIVLERFDMRLPDRYDSKHVVRLTDRRYEDYVADGFEYLIASGQVFGEAFDAPQRHPDVYAAYRRLFDQSQKLFIVTPSPGQPGPELRIYRLQNRN